MVLPGAGRFDGLTHDEQRGQFPIDGTPGGADAAGPEDTHSLEGTRLGLLTHLDATTA